MGVVSMKPDETGEVKATSPANGFRNRIPPTPTLNLSADLTNPARIDFVLQGAPIGYEAVPSFGRENIRIQYTTLGLFLYIHVRFVMFLSKAARNFWLFSPPCPLPPISMMIIYSLSERRRRSSFYRLHRVQVVVKRTINMVFVLATLFYCMALSLLVGASHHQHHQVSWKDSSPGPFTCCSPSSTVRWSISYHSWKWTTTEYWPPHNGYQGGLCLNSPSSRPSFFGCPHASTLW